MSKLDWVVQLVANVVGDQATAKMVVEVLMEEGLLSVGYGDADVDRVVQKFTDTFGTTKVSKYDRYAARRLAQKYGSQAIVGIIQLLGENREEKYAPVIGNIVQLEDKLVSVLNFLRKIKKSETLDI